MTWLLLPVTGAALLALVMARLGGPLAAKGGEKVFRPNRIVWMKDTND